MKTKTTNEYRLSPAENVEILSTINQENGLKIPIQITNRMCSEVRICMYKIAAVASNQNLADEFEKWISKIHQNKDDLQIHMFSFAHALYKFNKIPKEIYTFCKETFAGHLAILAAFKREIEPQTVI